jgi:coenzyme F420-0:L-glutamate ligase / coenzyme F420-1:gamma-L-glutamate ligase
VKSEKGRIRRLEIFAVPGIAEVRVGDDIGALVVAAMAEAGEAWCQGDIISIAQKVVSKAEGRTRRLVDIKPSTRAREIGSQCGKDPRKVQAILDESSEILRVVPAKPDGIVIARHRHGWVCANAGIDESNLGKHHAGDILLLPEDCDATARRISESIEAQTTIRPGVVITDTFGRPWRRGLVNVTLGLSGVTPIVDWIGCRDAYGRKLAVSQQALADEIAAASGLLSIKDAALPVVLFRNLHWEPQVAACGINYVRPINEDLFK